MLELILEPLPRLCLRAIPGRFFVLARIDRWSVLLPRLGLGLEVLLSRFHLLLGLGPRLGVGMIPRRTRLRLIDGRLGPVLRGLRPPPLREALAHVLHGAGRHPAQSLDGLAAEVHPAREPGGPRRPQSLTGGEVRVRRLRDVPLRDLPGLVEALAHPLRRVQQRPFRDAAALLDALLHALAELADHAASPLRDPRRLVDLLRRHRPHPGPDRRRDGLPRPVDPGGDGARRQRPQQIPLPLRFRLVPAHRLRVPGVPLRLDRGLLAEQLRPDVRALVPSPAVDPLQPADVPTQPALVLGQPVVRARLVLPERRLRLGEFRQGRLLLPPIGRVPLPQPPDVPRQPVPVDRLQFVSLPGGSRRQFARVPGEDAERAVGGPPEQRDALEVVRLGVALALHPLDAPVRVLGRPVVVLALVVEIGVDAGPTLEVLHPVVEGDPDALRLLVLGPVAVERVAEQQERHRPLLRPLVRVLGDQPEHLRVHVPLLRVPVGVEDGDVRDLHVQVRVAEMRPVQHHDLAVADPAGAAHAPASLSASSHSRPWNSCASRY